MAKKKKLFCNFVAAIVSLHIRIAVITKQSLLNFATNIIRF